MGENRIYFRTLSYTIIGLANNQNRNIELIAIFILITLPMVETEDY